MEREITSATTTHPPDDLIYRVAGVRDSEWFHRSGGMSVKDIENVLALANRRLESFDRILDFGCGCGRILLWMQQRVPAGRLCGVDIDKEAIEWLSLRCPDIALHVTPYLPPLPFAPTKFDLVYCHSVFTHLNTEYQDAWLQELYRVTAPGALLVVSFSGDHAFTELEKTWLEVGADPSTLRRELIEKGTLFIEDDSWKGGPFPDFYHSMFHTLPYICKHWGHFFTIRGHIAQGSLGLQDFILMERSNTNRHPQALPPSTQNSPSIPLPPEEMRALVGPTDLESFDNPSREFVYKEIPANLYESVFDFGCGCGRVARQLLQQKQKPHRYVGIDIHQGMIEWCNSNLATLDSNFVFLHHDVYNISLASNNSRRSTLQFPVGDREFSFVNAHSVFTHLLKEQAEYYLKEISRILTLNGIARTTWFFFDRAAFSWLQDHQVSLYVNDVDPTNAVIYDRGWFLDAVRNAGLAVAETIPATSPGHQWQIFLKVRQNDSADQFPTCNESIILCDYGLSDNESALDPSLKMNRLAQLEAENLELRSLVADLSLELRRRGGGLTK